MNLVDIAKLFNLSCIQDMDILGVGIDSRTILPGELFVAIRGERFDGHDFIVQAVANGAIAVVSERLMPGVSVPQLLVQDAVEALALMASMHRKMHACPTIALTGSNGKTTVKEMIASILPQPSYASFGNLNNRLGVPLCVLKLRPEHRYAVFELGASNMTDILHTAPMVHADVALINNIAPAHIEGFGSIDGVARAKGAIYTSLTQGGTAVVNDDDAYAHFWDADLTPACVLRFSMHHKAPIHAKDVVFDASGCAHFELITPVGSVKIDLTVPGEHHVANALAAAACSHALGIDLDFIAQGLKRFKGVPGRLTFLTGKNDSSIIDDTYNANLRSVLMALQVLAKKTGHRVMVLGDMGELGQWSRAHHEEVGIAARLLGIEQFYSYGTHSESASLAFGPGAKHYKTQEALIEAILPDLDSKTTVLVKGSRMSAMEKVVQQLI